MSTFYKVVLSEMKTEIPFKKCVYDHYLASDRHLQKYW